jgi:hypothetical protein
LEEHLKCKVVIGSYPHIYLVRNLKKVIDFLYIVYKKIIFYKLKTLNNYQQFTERFLNNKLTHNEKNIVKIIESSDITLNDSDMFNTIAERLYLKLNSKDRETLKIYLIAQNESFNSYIDNITL